jgi:hypothetical protein
MVVVMEILLAWMIGMNVVNVKIMSNIKNNYTLVNPLAHLEYEQCAVCQDGLPTECIITDFFMLSMPAGLYGLLELLVIVSHLHP